MSVLSISGSASETESSLCHQCFTLTCHKGSPCPKVSLYCVVDIEKCWSNLESVGNNLLHRSVKKMKTFFMAVLNRQVKLDQKITFLR